MSKEVSEIQSIEIQVMTYQALFSREYFAAHIIIDYKSGKEKVLPVPYQEGYEDDNDYEEAAAEVLTERKIITDWFTARGKVIENLSQYCQRRNINFSYNSQRLFKKSEVIEFGKRVRG